jgi:hypothetical protein
MTMMNSIVMLTIGFKRLIVGVTALHVTVYV